MSDFDRFVRYLVETLQGRSPESVHRPVAIDDLRRTVLPYRVHRNGLGLVSAEDYETLLLRLAAEEGGYARTFPPEAAERCREEVANPIPDLALLDELAEVTIAIEPAALSRIMAMDDEAPPFMPDSGPDLPLVYEPDQEAPQEPAAAPPSKPAAAEARPVRPEPAAPRAAEARPAVSRPSEPGTSVPRAAEPGPTADPRQPTGGRLAERLAPPPPEPRPDGGHPMPPPVHPVASAGQAASRCRFCAASLPAGRSVVFCPFCGHQLQVSRCPRCETELEPGWRHCISCGQPMGPPRAGS